MQIIEQGLVSKTGKSATCEDAIVVNEHFVGVIDGSTSKVKRLWDGRTSGKMAALLLVDAISTLPAESTGDEAIRALTAALATYYHQHNVYDELLADPKMRLAATVALYSSHRREVWMVGDGQCMIDERAFTNPMHIDQITSDARALFLESELARGKTIAELLEHDTAREVIFPLLERQSLFENVLPVTMYGYGVINGFDVPAPYIRTIPVAADATYVVLASDGYPFIQSTFQASEQELAHVLAEDPLCMRHFKSTKGLLLGNLSFDDRAYLRLRI